MTVQICFTYNNQFFQFFIYAAAYQAYSMEKYKEWA